VTRSKAFRESRENAREERGEDMQTRRDYKNNTGSSDWELTSSLENQRSKIDKEVQKR